MKRLIIWLALLLPLLVNAQTNGTIQKTASTGTIRGSFGSLGLDTLPRVTGALVDGYILKYHAATNKWYASPDPTSSSYWQRSGDTLSPLNLGDRMYYSFADTTSLPYTHITVRDTINYLSSTGQDSYGEAVTFSGKKIGGTRTGLQWGKFITSQVDASNTADWLYSGFYLHPNLVGVAGNARITGSGDVYDAASFSAFTNFNGTGDLTYRYGLTVSPANVGGSGSLLNERGIVIGDLSGTVSTMPIESIGNDPSSFAGRIDYKTNIGAQFTTRSLIDKGYADSSALLRVPYSGANSNVNLGIYSISGVAGNFSGSVKAGDATGISGYTLQAKAATNKRVGFTDGGSYGTWVYMNDANSYTIGGIDASALAINGLTGGATTFGGNISASNFSGSSSGTNTGDQNLAPYAPLASPALTGSPTAPTQSAGDNSTKIATTAYVDGAVGSASGNRYTPTYSNVTNTTSVTSGGDSFYQRNGNIVSVRGYVQFQTVAGGGTSSVISVNLPIASNLIATTDLIGSAPFSQIAATSNAAIVGEVSADIAHITFLSNTATTNAAFIYEFSYEVK